MLIAHDLPLPAADVAVMLQRVSDTGDWYLARDPSLQLEQLLDRGTVRISHEGRGYRATLETTPEVAAFGETVDAALFRVYERERTRRDDAEAEGD